jgi:hypothetical protein
MGTPSGTVLLSITGLCAALVLAIWATARPVEAVVGHARRMRPTSTIIPAYTTAEMIEIALASGAPISGWSAHGGSPVALTVTSTALELWSGTETEPRMVLSHSAIITTALVTATYKARSVQALGVRSTHTALILVPAYRPATNKTRSDKTGLRTALTAIRSV